MRIALWIGLGLALGGAAIAIVIYRLGGGRPQKPQLDRFMAGRGPGVVLAPAARRPAQPLPHRGAHR